MQTRNKKNHRQLRLPLLLVSFFLFLSSCGPLVHPADVSLLCALNDSNCDTDKDGKLNGSDNCPDDRNPDQRDADKDGVGDACEDDAPVPTANGQSCSQETKENGSCSLNAANHGDSDGTCETGYTSSCSYTCDNGAWIPTTGFTDTCVAPQGCSEEIEDNCSLNAVSHGASDGNCETGYMGICSYTCDNEQWTEVSNTCVAPQGCSEEIEDNCSLNAVSHGASDGNCETGYTGICSYTCDNEQWTEVSNTCVAPQGCSEEIEDNCSLNAVSHGASDGNCETGYTGICSYTCDNEQWTEVSNTCVAPQGCSEEIEDNCSLNAVSHGASDGNCETDYTGICSYTCDNEQWTEVSNTCLFDTDGDKVADLDDSCMNSQNTGSFTSNSSTDTDGDGCEDAKEDVDDDGDGLIEIRNEEMLKNIRNNPRGDSYVVSGNPVDRSGCGGTLGITVCSGYELFSSSGGENTIMLDEDWVPSDDNFAATLEGNGNTISNLTIAASDGNDNFGFFKAIGSSGVVQNLKIEGVTVTGTGGDKVGCLAGSLESGGKIANVEITSGSVNAGARSGLGGLVGYSEGEISNSSASVHIQTTSPLVGGLVGHNKGTIMDSRAMGNNHINATGEFADNVGGLVGFNEGTIMNSSATLNVRGYDNVGGLVGENNTIGKITNAYATRNVTGNNNVGGLIGKNSKGDIENIYATGTVSGASSVGGLVGNNDGDIENAYATGNNDVTGTADNVGGLVGENKSNTTIRNSYAKRQTVSGSGGVGGLVGLNKGTIRNSYAVTETVSGTSSGSVGGLVGTNESSIQYSYALGSVSGLRKGGLVGWDDTNSMLSVKNSYIDMSNTEAIIGYGTNQRNASRKDLKKLTASISGWGNEAEALNNWIFGSNAQYPSLRSTEVINGKYLLLCGQVAPQVPTTTEGRPPGYPCP